MSEKIKNGTSVTWKSQVRGTWKKKTGTVLRFLDKGVDARLYIGKTTKISSLQTRTPESAHVRYLVRAEDKNGKTVYFTPRASTLHAAVEKEASKPAKKPQKKSAAPVTAVAADDDALAADDDALAA